MKLRQLKRRQPRPEMLNGYVVRRNVRIPHPDGSTLVMRRCVIMPAAPDPDIMKLMMAVGMKPSTEQPGISVTYW